MWGSAGASGRGPAAAQHTVVLLIDDLGYGDTAFNGAEYATPTIDGMAKGGIVLNQSYVMQLCSPTRGSLLSSRYAYNIGMDGSVLTGNAGRCIPANMSTMGDQMQNNGVRTAMIGKYDAGYSSWACTPNCRGFEYWLGYYGAAEDYFLHGGKDSLDFHENYEQAPQYRGEYSTELFARKAVDWVHNATDHGKGTDRTFLYLATQAVHGPIEAPPQYFAGCTHIKDINRKTYCAMMQALDQGIANVTAAYKQLGIFDTTLWLFLADNGGMPNEGGYNKPLRGHKATVWEGGIRSNTFLHWTGFPEGAKGSVYGGMVHVSDWGVTLMAAMGFKAKERPGQIPFDGLDVWAAVVSGGPSPRTEMLLSMRDAGECGTGAGPSSIPTGWPCKYYGELAYRKGAYKLIYGHTALRGKEGDTCTNASCWNGWTQPPDVGALRPPPILPLRSGQPPNSSVYDWGGVFLFNIELDPLEEHDLSASEPQMVAALVKALAAYNLSQISQSVLPFKGTRNVETCGVGPDRAQWHLKCSVPWLKSAPGDRCRASPGPPPGPAPGPSPSPGPSHASHLTESVNWDVTATMLKLKGWVCYGNIANRVSLRVDNGPAMVFDANETVAESESVGSPCGAEKLGRFHADIAATARQDFTNGKHEVTGKVLLGGGMEAVLGDSPGCIDGGKAAQCSPDQP